MTLDGPTLHACSCGGRCFDRDPARDPRSFPRCRFEVELRDLELDRSRWAKRGHEIADELARLASSLGAAENRLAAKELVKVEVERVRALAEEVEGGH